MRPTKTITFQPDKDVESLLRKAIVRIAGVGKKNRRGAQTKAINAALRDYYAELAGKREAGIAAK